MSTPERVFRFALYGRTNAGKTCILAAMAMPHASRPGVSCVWRGTEADAPRPSGPEADWLPDDPAAVRYRSAAWLRRAVGRMAAGEAPEATPPGREPFRYRFDIRRDGCEYPVELIDYAGELTDPDISADELAARLKRHFRELDGLLLLAAVPRAGGGNELPQELHRLQMAFAELRKGREGSLPEGALVGLVVNKWDRRAADAGPEALREFLASDAGRSHRTILDFLRPEEARDFEAFATSAFGRAGGDGAMDLPPRESPLPSFGLEEPFLWAARRRLEKEADAELRRVEDEAAHFTWWHVLQPFWGRRGRLAGVVRRLRADYPGDFPHAARAERALESTRRAYLGQFAALAAVLFLAWGRPRRPSTACATPSTGPPSRRRRPNSPSWKPPKIGWRPSPTATSSARRSAGPSWPRPGRGATWNASGRRSRASARKHLAKLHAELDVDVFLYKILWGESGWSAVADNGVEVWLNSDGDKKIDAREVPSHRGESRADVGSFAVRGKLDDTVTLRVKVTCQSGNFPFSSRANGEGEQAVTIADLVKKGCKVQLNRFDNKAYFRPTIKDFEEPNLPLYRK